MHSTVTGSNVPSKNIRPKSSTVSDRKRGELKHFKVSVDSSESAPKKKFKKKKCMNKLQLTFPVAKIPGRERKDREKFSSARETDNDWDAIVHDKGIDITRARIMHLIDRLFLRLLLTNAL